jgi:hypothetical protein
MFAAEEFYNFAKEAGIVDNLAPTYFWLVIGSMIMSVSGYFSMPQDFFEKQANEINDEMADSYKNGLFVDGDYQKFQEIFDQQLNDAKENDNDSKPDPYYHAGIYNMLLASAAAMNIRDASLLQSLEDDICRPCFNELLACCRKSEDFKNEYHKSHPRIELSEAVCNQYADQIWTIMTTMLKHCDSKGYDVNKIKLFSMICMILLISFSIDNELSDRKYRAILKAISDCFVKIGTPPITADEFTKLKQGITDEYEEDPQGAPALISIGARYIMIALEAAFDGSDFENSEFHEEMQGIAERSVKYLLFNSFSPLPPESMVMLF